MSAGEGSGGQEKRSVLLLCVLLSMAVVTVLSSSYTDRARRTVEVAFSEPTARASSEVVPPPTVGVHELLRERTLVLATAGDDGRDPATAQVAAAAVDDEVQVLRVDLLEGETARSHRLAEARLEPLPLLAPGRLPTLTPEVARRLLTDERVPRVHVRGRALRQATTLTGVVVLEPGAVLYLDDVVVHGCLVSAAALREAAVADGLGLAELDALGDPSSDGRSDRGPPVVQVDGTLRIEPHEALPGLGVWMPDGVLRTGPEQVGVLQLAGDVVARELVLEAPGALLGRVATLGAALLDDGLARPDPRRGLAPWAPALELDVAWVARSVAFLPPDLEVGAEALSR